MDDYEALTLTLYGETRGEPEAGKLAVAHVIWNRAQRHHLSVKDVCLAPHQFSCWTLEAQTLAEAARRLAIGAHDPALEECAAVAGAVLDGAHGGDPTKGATHYYAPAAMVPAGRVPSWAANKVPSAVIGGHLFFNDIDGPAPAAAV
jgi:N-acetylmuramoyl-L-alanine amidase